MANQQTLTLQEFLAAVNRDIRRELRFADECMEQAGLLHRGELRFVGAQFLRCAATAMCNATALAAEVLATGGTPPAGPQCRHDLVPYWPRLRRDRARLVQAVRHYRHRWGGSTEIRAVAFCRAVSGNRTDKTLAVESHPPPGGSPEPPRRCRASRDYRSGAG